MEVGTSGTAVAGQLWAGLTVSGVRGVTRRANTRKGLTPEAGVCGQGGLGSPRLASYPISRVERLLEADACPKGARESATQG